MIVENLRVIQERHGFLPEAEIQALSERLGVPLHRLNEVISFFPHFRVELPPAVSVKVCRDLACRLRGSARLLELLKAEATAIGDTTRIAVEEVSCLGRCDGAPAVLMELNQAGGQE